MPSTADYQAFFQSRQRELEDDQEMIWISSEVPVEALQASYPLGIFPWPGDDETFIPWVWPEVRGVLPLANFRLGRSTRRQLARARFRVTFDQAFDQVIQACAGCPSRETWIHPVMIKGYGTAHRRGFAHSVEVWEGEDLVGGLYGIDLAGTFSGESMFHTRPNAGKAAIAALVARLDSRGRHLLDIQQLTPHLKAMGAEEWDRAAYQAAQKRAAAQVSEF